MKKLAVIPSLLTLGNAFCGFLAIIKAVDASTAHALGDMDTFYSCMETSAVVIFLAMVFDALDGKVARLTNQASDFGAQLDSLSDAVTFGVAPAVIAKVLICSAGKELMPWIANHPRLFFPITALFALMAIMRLAKFNVETSSHEESAHERFSGLPTPAAGGLIAATALFWVHRQMGGERLLLSNLPAGLFDIILVTLPWLLLTAGLAMVSPLPYPHLVNLLFRRRKGFRFLATLVIVLVCSAVCYEAVLFLLILVYLCMGPVVALMDKLGRGDKGGRVLQGPRSATG